MGLHKNINHKSFPNQGAHLGKSVEVCFDYDTSNTTSGSIVRDDNEDPWMTIIRLSSGRYVLSTECMYSVED